MLETLDYTIRIVHRLFYISICTLLCLRSTLRLNGLYQEISIIKNSNFKVHAFSSFQLMRKVEWTHTELEACKTCGQIACF